MSEQKACREKQWWEYYPLHKVWCNDLFPLVPRFSFRRGDQWNANNWNLHWMFINVWSMEHFSFGLDFGMSFDEVYVGVILPWLRITFGIRHAHNEFSWKLSRMFRRKPALKNERGEYN